MQESSATPRFFGGCGRLLHALNPPRSAFLYLQFLARCHPYILFHFYTCIYYMYNVHVCQIGRYKQQDFPSSLKYLYILPHGLATAYIHMHCMSMVQSLNVWYMYTVHFVCCYSWIGSGWRRWVECARERTWTE